MAIKRPTAEEIEAARSPSGGWTKAQLAEWGVSWPPPAGWKIELSTGRGPGFDRAECAAFGCHKWTRRYVTPGGVGVYLCREHWARVPKRLRLLTNRSIRLDHRYGGEKNRARADRLWAKCVDHLNRDIGL